MSTVELNKIKANINQYISINTFFSTSTSSNAATDFFAGATSQRPLAEWVLFEIKIDPQNLSDKPFAAIHQCSMNKDENEILFSMGTIFQIESCEPFNENFWLITLKSSNEQNEDIKQLSSYYQKQIGESSSLMILGEFLHKLFQFDKAERYYQLLFNELPEDNYEDRGMALNNIGTIYTDKGKINEALEYLYRALDIYSKNLPLEHLGLAEVYSNLASAYSTIDKHTLAFQYQHKALRIQRKLLPPDDLILATTYNNMADMYSDVNNLKKAIIYFQKTLHIELKKLPMNHPDLAVTYNNMGHAYIIINEFSKAHECLQKALDIRLAALPPTHLDLADSYRAIGLLQTDLGNTTDALENHYKALNIYSTSHSNLNHERLAQTHIDIALLLSNHDYRVAAMKHSKQALYHTQQQLNPDIYTMAKIYNGLAESYIDQHKYKAASKQCHRALQLKCQSQRPDDTVFVITYSTLGSICYYQNQYNKALRFYKYAAHCHRHIFPVRQDCLAQIYKDIAYVYYKKQSKQKSLFYFKKALSLRLEYDKNNYNDIGLINHEIGTLYENDKVDNRRALRYYKRALQYYSKANLPNTTRLAKVYLNLGNIRYKTNDFLKAKRCSIKALNYERNNNSKEKLLIVQIYILLGLINRSMNQLRKARENFQEALNISIEQKNSDIPTSKLIDNDIFIRLHNDIGTLFLKERNLSDALPYLKNALNFAKTLSVVDINEKKRVEIQLATTHYLIGWFNMERNKYQIARKYFKLAFTILSKYSDTEHHSRGLICLQMGIIWFMNMDYRKAIAFLKRARKSFLQSTETSYIDVPLYETYSLLSASYRQQENQIKAQDFYEQARDLRQRSPSIEYKTDIDQIIDINLQSL